MLKHTSALHINPSTKEKLDRFLSVFVFPLLLIYFELVFHHSTVGAFSFGSFINTALFVCCYGFLLAFLHALLTRVFPKARIPVTAVLLFVSAVPYLIEYFIYLQFKVFYDLTTVTAGTADAVGGFTDRIFALMFGLRGIIRLILYLWPFAVYLILSHKQKKTPLIPTRHPLMYLGLSLPFYLLALFFVLISSVRLSTYTNEYSFQTAVNQFGLSTGIRLDLKKAIQGRGVSFEGDEPMPWQPVLDAGNVIQAEIDRQNQPEPEVEPEPEIVYEPNVLNIDFAAKAQETTGTVSELFDYISGLTPSLKNKYTGLFKGKNLIFISAEAFSAEVIDEKLTPALYRMATKGIQFTDYYQPASAGTTGGEYQNIFGLLPTDSGESFKDIVDHDNSQIISWRLNDLGYNGWAFHNNDYTFYSRDLTHNALGFSNGFMGYGNGMEEYVTDQWPQSDLEMLQGTLPLYIGQQPFDIYYMSVSGHSGYSTSENSMASKNWDRVQDLPYSDQVKGYIAANLELEDAMAYLIDALEKAGIADDTVIVLGADHFPYGLDDAAVGGSTPYLDELYGYTVTNFVDRDHNRLLLWSGCLEKMDPIVVDQPSSSLDILPTLLNLFGLDFDSRLFPGRDVLSTAEPLYFDMNYDWKTDLGTYIAETDTFTPVSEDVEIPENYVEKIKRRVRNKINYCYGVLDNDFYSYVFD